MAYGPLKAKVAHEFEEPFVCASLTLCPFLEVGLGGYLGVVGIQIFMENQSRCK